MNSRAQVSLEYLITIMFAIVLVITVTIIAFNITKLADRAQAQVINNRDSAISTLMS